MVDTVEDGGLSGSIGADEAEDLPLVHLKADVVHRPQSPEILGDPL